MASPLHWGSWRADRRARNGHSQEIPVIRPGATIVLFALCIATSCVLRTPTLTARTPSLIAGAPLPSPSGPPSDPGAAPPEDNQVIEAGCTFSGNDIKGEPGTVRQVSCPACDKAAVVFGTDTYSGMSPVCTAAMHAGAIPARGGHATIVLETGRPAYRGSKRNGVTTGDYSSYRSSFRFEGVVAAAAPPEAPAAPQVIEAGCSFHSNEIHAEPGAVRRVSCPSGCAQTGVVWGSDPYTGDTPICTAAIHAGLISNDRGGELMIVLEEGKPAYRGSKRNGIQSNDWGASRASFRFKR
jgi:ribosomal protein S27E